MKTLEVKDMEQRIYDCIIIGGGPAGYTAALYAARAGLSTLVLEKFSAGGQMTETEAIENYPGVDETIDGFTLGARMQAAAERFGAAVEQTEVIAVDLAAHPKRITTDAGDRLGRTVIIATGATHRHLGIAHEEELAGRGVAYCALCDGMFYRGKTVAVVGGGNSAAADVRFLSRVCKKVYLIHRRDTLRADKVYREPLLAIENMEFLPDSVIGELLYDTRLNGLIVQNRKTGEQRRLEVDGLFVSVGREPVTKLFRGQVALDSAGYIVADESTQTSIPGVFAAGDVRTKALRQIVTATSDGAVAATYAERYLAERK